MTSSRSPLRIAMLGCGVVGSEVARQLLDHSTELGLRVGAELELVGIAVRDLRARAGIDESLFTTDAMALVTREDVDVVVEVMGGINPAKELILAALDHGASVVTANKALLAAEGEVLHRAAAVAQRDLYYEAAVAGAIPIVRPLRGSLAGDHVERVLGIVNGTTNYILDQMTTTGADFSDALSQAQHLGYAEADPTADVEGHDAAAKAAILASLAFHTRVTMDDVHCEGISSVSADEVAAAAEMGHVVKLLAICERSADGSSVSARVHPAMIPQSHPLASVRGAFNAVFVESAAAGELMFYGQGAGGAPTASAVLGDVVTVARHRRDDVFGPEDTSHADLAIQPMGEVLTRYFVSLDVADRAGVLAAVAHAFAERGISIKTVRQEGHGDDARLVVVTHSAADADLAETVAVLRELDMVRGVSSVMRVEGEQ